jgi:acetyltransferase-like isoleucine patch superfamily enzyme
MVDSEFVNTTSGPIHMREASIIGSSAIVLPNVEFGEGSVLGSLSLAMIDLESHWIYIGNPAKKYRKASSLYKDKINDFIKKTQT